MTITVRLAAEADLDRLAEFEVQIARISFDVDAVDDPAVHRERLAQAWRDDPSGMLVACDRSDAVIGWLWLVPSTNFATGARYGNFRSLAVDTSAVDSSAVDSSARAADAPPSTRIADALWRRALWDARDRGLTEIIGHVHVRNTAMRVLYRRYGFTPSRLTLRRVLPP